MPLVLTTHAERIPRRRFVDTPSPVPLWSILHRYADQLYAELHTVWETLFADARASVDTPALRDALRRVNLLDAERLVMTAWQDEVSRSARQVLRPLFRETVAKTAAAVQATPSAATPELLTVQFNVAAPEVLAVIDTYIGTQIVAIERSTLLAVRATIRQGFAEGHGVARMARDLRGTLGLTPRQARTIESLRTRLQEQGKTAVQVQRDVVRATELGIRRRAVVVARTESIAAASMGQDELWRAAERQGLWDSTRMRRGWLITPDERLCAICRAIPGLNPDGVALGQPFQTPKGPVMYPPTHQQCRCAVRPQVLSAGPAG